MNRWFVLSVAATVGLTACSKQEEQPKAPPAAPQSMMPMQAPNTGTIVQLLQASGYTYAEVDVGGGQKVWIAGGPINAKTGDTVQWGDYAIMRQFNAKSLNRTFDQILFVNSWGPAGGAQSQVAPHGMQPGQAHPPMPQQTAAPAAGGGGTSGKVKSVTNAGGYSYIEVERPGGSQWLAVPETRVKAGDTIQWGGGMVMNQFRSDSMNRTFDQIVFAGGITVAK